MSQERKCSRDDCPPSNINTASTAKCASCDSYYHLPCYGVQQPTNEIFVIKNIVFLCDDCLITSPSPKRKNSANKNIKQGTNNTNVVLSTPATTISDIRQKVISNTNNESLIELMSTVATTLGEHTSTIVSLKKSVDSMHTTVKANNNNVGIKTYAQALGTSNSKQTIRVVSENSNSKTTTVNSSVLEMKTRFKQRELTSGTNEVTNHKLGSPILNIRNNNFNQRQKLTKSIYVSRLQTKVTVDDLLDYIKQRMPEINETDILLRMLVKRDQPLDHLSFISFRLQCTDSLYETLILPSFWPSHVMIGEFFERESVNKSVPMNDLLSPRIHQDESENVTPKNVRLQQQVVQDAHSNLQMETV